ncbi:hypothetical protein [Cellulosimicrobium sp. CUA-896]|uniref:Acg family FMN-binding oxidoreductase n=1 Tax=Cellulosimicrobium sp. CUA-896 TaxID=1517881 RepID=UPI000966F886|nr:hypothetical protein [Cellulosimicrobium sp. CUA-896]OLT53176.1 hypothetical protein BJF88_12810 [Cellulosimicrobium sp. CUA-896]
MEGRSTYVERIVEAGMRAPSIHNVQPWSVETDGETLDVRVDRARMLPGIDPAGRETFLSCGAFLLNVRVAAEREGLDASVRLLPRRDDPLLVARVTLAPLVAPTFDEPGLDDALATRRTARGNTPDRPVDPDVLAALRRAVVLEDADVTFLDPRDAARGHLLSTMRRAEALASLAPARVAIDREWLGVPRGRSDGVPVDSLGGWFADPVLDVPAPARDEAGGARTFEGRATVAVLTTPGDRPDDWLVAGQALERMLLVAATHGVHAAFATQVLEDPSTRSAVERAYCPEASAQMLMRLGYGAAGPTTPRRELDDVLRRRAGTHAATARRGG